MRTYPEDRVPADLRTKSQLRKSGLTPVAAHTAYMVIPPKRRKYKLYSLENVTTLDPNMGFSILREITSEDELRRIEDMFRRLRERHEGNDD
ncbi:hypothetical protein [Paenibacillus sp. J22TS3]|uniref:hypothetical protein n=1 Tax=Paenibacillus sp. J22TS3 TaxID=2807192 RepID=UPI001B286F94|nr:hypothetical protein [Paenibacillus sp. J22TS3]GIP24208.1 hypothetical protein J22TS3_44830 [Paenibacillus sp. J22TS3]